jgi:hypothetical protein
MAEAADVDTKAQAQAEAEAATTSGLVLNVI